MRLLRFFYVLCLFGLAAACASAPSSRPGGAADQSSLRLCSGVKISNAPPTDASGRIVNFNPTATVSGVRLLRAPVNACVSSGFGPRRGGASSFHHGVDLYTGNSSAVYAGGDGVIESVDTLRGYGKTILIRHGRGVKTRYAHLSDYAPGVRTGSRVTIGQMIGRTGRTGNATAVHLHYEILVNERAQNPLTVSR